MPDSVKKLQNVYLKDLVVCVTKLTPNTKPLITDHRVQVFNK